MAIDRTKTLRQAEKLLREAIPRGLTALDFNTLPVRTAPLLLGHPRAP